MLNLLKMQLMDLLNQIVFQKIKFIKKKLIMTNFIFINHRKKKLKLRYYFKKKFQKLSQE